MPRYKKLGKDCSKIQLGMGQALTGLIGRWESTKIIDKVQSFSKRLGVAYGFRHESRIYIADS